MKQNKSTGGEVRIRISGLSNGLHDYHFSAEPAAIGLAPNFQGPVEIEAHLDKTARQIYLRIGIRTSGQFQCDRCLDEFEQKISTGYVMLYVTDQSLAASYPEDEVTVLDPDQTYIDATDDVRQMVLFAVPLKLLCQEHCRGLCPSCGTNRNTGSCKCAEQTTDPRWERLQGLRDT